MSYLRLPVMASVAVCCFAGWLAAAGQESTPPEEFVLDTLAESVQVQSKCGKYFGYNTYPGVSDKCISFNYVSGKNIYFRTVAISTVKTVINNDKKEPTVQFTAPSEITIQISQADFEKEKECLPAPKKE